MNGPGEKSEKSEKADKKAKVGFPQPTGATDLRSRVPAMADDALVVLQANAKRMLTSGNAAQKAAAGDLIPIVENEIAERRAKKLASQPARKTATRKPKAPKPDSAPAS